MNAIFAKEAMKHPVPFNPIHLSDSVNTKYQEAFPTLTADENTLVFMRRDPAGKDWNEDFYISHFNKDHWTNARNMGDALNSIYQDGAMSLTNLGNEMYFASDRKGGFGTQDIYYSQRKIINGLILKILGPLLILFRGNRSQVFLLMEKLYIL